jgi:hypothetical protein
MTQSELARTEASFSILLKAFDDTFSQTVHSRAAYYQVISFGMPGLNPTFDRDPMTGQSYWTYRGSVYVEYDCCHFERREKSSTWRQLLEISPRTSFRMLFRDLGSISTTDSSPSQKHCTPIRPIHRV